MAHKTLLWMLATSLALLPARLAPQDAPPPIRSSSVNGINIPAIPGAPFSATVVVESELYVDDVEAQVYRTIGLIARDSQGRTHNETRRLMPESFHGSPALLSLRLYDPETRIRIVCDPGSKIARREIVPQKPPAASPAPNPTLRTEDLGMTTLNGLQAKGTRRTFAAPRAHLGWGKRPEVQEETWYSEDLHIDLLTRLTDSRVGVQTIGISNLKRGEPTASMFQVPPGYRIFNVVEPPPQPAAGSTR